jgi:NAD(P)-dependent dehydrogenase (short-subunit alcohol dehydrogenase family)
MPTERATVLQNRRVSDRDDVDKLVAKQVKKFGRLDVLVSNAGVAAMGTAVGQAQDWDRIMANGRVLYGARAAMPHPDGQRRLHRQRRIGVGAGWRLGSGVLQQRVQRARWST